jgi:hypothetical protein
MDIPSVSLLRPLVNQAYLGWRHLRRLPAAPLWWLWLATILAHLLSLLGGVIVPHTEGVVTSEPDTPVLRASPSLPPVLQERGWFILPQVLRPGEFPFPLVPLPRVVGRASPLAGRFEPGRVAGLAGPKSGAVCYVILKTNYNILEISTTC